LAVLIVFNILYSECLPTWILVN